MLSSCCLMSSRVIVKKLPFPSSLSTITSPPHCSAMGFKNDRGRSLRDRLRFPEKSKRNEEFFMMHSLPKGRGLCDLHDQQQISIAHWYVYPTRAQVRAMPLV